jgi:hypothetical protein
VQPAAPTGDTRARRTPQHAVRTPMQPLLQRQRSKTAPKVKNAGRRVTRVAHTSTKDDQKTTRELRELPTPPHFALAFSNAFF